jgi:hypothetical protein
VPLKGEGFGNGILKVYSSEEGGLEFPEKRAFLNGLVD